MTAVRRLLILVSLAALVGAAGVALVYYQRLQEPHKGYDGPERFVEIPSGAGPRAIGRRLVSAGVVKDLATWELALRISGDGARLKAGEYRFDRSMTPGEVVAQIVEGRVHLRPITFPEGLTAREMSILYEKSGMGSAEAFVAAAGRGSLVHDLDPTAPDLEGYLFPETYTLPRSATPEQLVDSMVARFRKVLTDEMRRKAQEKGLSVRQLVTLASIVEKETGRPEERATVAAVYANRLKIGMPLQCDPTVIYGLQKAGKYDGNLTKENLGFDSPYNTYRYPGLPPGPIASPGQASIAAALEPAAVNYLYFVSRNDGSHVFASTLAEHNRNVYEHQILYFRKKRLEARGK